ncbi:hypothetical protein JG688_00010847 [Phytophthora aleatoria]|uniref:Uncharacterized protein n=1 Tax=Phytophthora aleatoria TaxID=2496075 RepID=A0A8J5J4L4_9STRA|nr:hypothetical protein JG688_00010847 [Phytophthora aleatoria]
MDLHSKIAADGRVSKLTLGELVRCLFATSRRKQAYTIYNSERQESKVDQIRSLSLYCESTLRTLGFEAVCSAVVVCQTTTELHLRLNMDPNIVDTQHWWMWIAYVFFSKRARTSSSIQKLRLSGLHNMCTADMKGFLAVVVSRHPEELLIGCPRGKIDERNATLKGRSRIRWQGEARAQPTNGYRDLSFSQALPFVRTFSDNGESTWVDVLIPGYGRCQVQRKDLEFETPSLGRREGGIKSLSIEFYKGTTPDSTGLPMFINAVGSQLTTLSIEGPRMQLDENEILRSCLNLEELTLCGRLADVKLDFREYRANKEPIPTLNCHWDNLRALSMDISDAANPLTKMVGRLRVRLDNRFGHWNSGSFNPDTFAGDVNALVNMLATNRYLEYSEIYVPTAKHNEVIDQFREYHLKPIAKPSKLPLEIKVGFLSVMSARTPTAKKTRNSSLLLGAGGCEVNSRIGSTIFSLAAPPVLRQVYCRSESDMWSFPWLQ